jgi:hypothetical protein
MVHEDKEEEEEEEEGKEWKEDKKMLPEHMKPPLQRGRRR